MSLPVRYPALDGLRAVAVALVMVGHYAHRTEIGLLGVAIFYVLSGFLITGLLLAEYDRTGTVRLGAFYARRALRIMPAAYVFFLVAWLVLRKTEANPPTGAWLSSLFYYSDYWSALHFRPSTQITHTWSLAVEERFYLGWPVLLLLWRPKGMLTVWRWLGLAILMVWSWRLGLSLIGLPADRVTHYLQFAFDCRLDYLALGCALATAWHTDLWRAVSNASQAHRWLPIIPVVALASLTLTLGRWRWWALSFPLEGALITAMLVLLMAARWRWLDHPVARSLGMLSYSIYLYHMLAWYLAGEVVTHPVLHGVLGALLTLPLAWLSYAFVERPALRWRDRRVPAQRTAVRPRVAVGTG